MISLEEILAKKMLGKEVTVRGWVYRRRKSGKILFLIIRDRGAIIQCILEEKAIGTALFEKATTISIESSVEIKGIVREEPRSPGGIEISGTHIELIGLSEVFPITRDQSVSFLLDNRHLWLRSRKLTFILQIKAALFEAAREWFKLNGYLEVQCPIFITAAVEGGSTLFQMKYFDTVAYLTQSSQFYLESLIFSLGKVYTIAPSFRAEKSRTIRHLTEFWMLEAEIPFCDSNLNMEIQEDLVAHMCQSVAQTKKEELEFLGRNPSDLMIKPPFERLSYSEAIEDLHKLGSKIEWGQDLGAEDERALTINRKSPIFIYDYHSTAKAFYHKPDPSNPEVVNCADLLAPEGHGEIIGGGQRIHDKDELLQRIEAANLQAKDYGWYIDLRKYGTVPHAGFGLGMERFVKWICNLESIRDTIAYPRDMRRLYP
ncbi:MAG TPA: asparagine--tRNA ligase [Candidatus Deferrimicrobium sp.]|nr:asparagine--tRNA ligase [Candidatus Deferrimicrobium sp.]